MNAEIRKIDPNKKSLDLKKNHHAADDFEQWSYSWKSKNRKHIVY